MNLSLLTRSMIFLVLISALYMRFGLSISIDTYCLLTAAYVLLETDIIPTLKLPPMLEMIRVFGVLPSSPDRATVYGQAHVYMFGWLVYKFRPRFSSYFYPFCVDSDHYYQNFGKRALEDAKRMGIDNALACADAAFIRYNPSWRRLEKIRKTDELLALVATQTTYVADHNSYLSTARYTECEELQSGQVEETLTLLSNERLSAPIIEESFLNIDI